MCLVPQFFPRFSKIFWRKPERDRELRVWKTAQSKAFPGSLQGMITLHQEADVNVSIPTGAGRVSSVNIRKKWNAEIQFPMCWVKTWLYFGGCLWPNPAEVIRLPTLSSVSSGSRSVMAPMKPTGLLDNYQFFRWSFQTPWLAGPCRQNDFCGQVSGSVPWPWCSVHEISPKLQNRADRDSKLHVFTTRMIHRIFEDRSCSWLKMDLLTRWVVLTRDGPVLMTCKGHDVQGQGGQDREEDDKHAEDPKNWDDPSS